MPHVQDGHHWPWEFHVGQITKHALISLKIVSNCCLVVTIQKMYCLMHLRCLAFKLHKIIGQRSFQICTGSQNLKLVKDKFWYYCYNYNQLKSRKMDHKVLQQSSSNFENGHDITRVLGLPRVQMQISAVQYGIPKSRSMWILDMRNAAE